MKFVTDDNIDYVSKPARKGEKLMYTSMETSGNIGQIEGSNISEKLDAYNSIKSNKEKSNAYLREQRQTR